MPRKPKSEEVVTPAVEEIIEVSDTPEAEIIAESVSEEISEPDSTVSTEEKKPKSRRCHYCQSKTQPTYLDSITLKKYLSDRARILPKNRTGLCSKHQHRLSIAIKRARHLSLLPFVPSL